MCSILAVKKLILRLFVFYYEQYLYITQMPGENKPVLREKKERVRLAVNHYHISLEQLEGQFSGM